MQRVEFACRHGEPGEDELRDVDFVAIECQSSHGAECRSRTPAADVASASTM